MLIVACCLGFAASAQIIPLKAYSSKDGLSSSQALCVYQHYDSKLWVGTSGGGVNVFNGEKFHRIPNAPELENNTVYDITRIDSTVFIGTSNGLFLLDKESKLTAFKMDDGLPNSMVFKIFQDSKKRIWIATRSGAVIFEDSTFVTPPYPFVQSLNIFNIYEDSQSNLWFCTFKNGLLRLNEDLPDSAKVKMYRVNPKKMDVPFIDHFVGDIKEIEPGKYLVAGRKDLMIFQNEKYTELFKNVKDASFWSILQDSKKNFWVASDRGAYKFTRDDLIKGDNKYARYRGSQNNSILKIWKIFEDKDGFIWFVDNEKGIARIVTENVLSNGGTKGLPKTDVNWIHHTNDSLIVGTEKGLYISYKGNFKHQFLNVKQNPEFPMGKKIRHGFFDQGGTLLLATNSGIVKYNNGTSVVCLPNDPNGNGLFYAKTRSLYKDSKGTIWVGTAGGVAQLINDKIVPWLPLKGKTEPCYGFLEDGNRLYVASRGLIVVENGKVRNDFDKTGFTKGIVNNIVKTQHGIWFGTEEGLFKLKDDKFSKVSPNKVGSSSVTSMIADDRGNLYCGRLNGFTVIKFIKDSITVENYNHDLGFVKAQCSHNAIDIDIDGNVYFGTDDGFTIFEYPKFHKNKTIPHILLEKVELRDSLLATRVYAKDNHSSVHLNYYENSISFSYHAIDYQSQNNVKYHTVLKGYKNNKIKIGSDNKREYYNLPPGKYTFEVFAVGIDGLKSDTISYEFRIEQPFWQKWWFYLICFVIVAIWAFSYYQIRQNNKLLNRQKTIILDQKKIVEEKNQEIIDSISYAKRIQSAILPKRNFITSDLPEHFITYIPRDIVSGDFYWVEKVGGKVYFAAADCTGHGVPGAMVSVMCSNLLTKAVLEMNAEKPCQVLDNVNELLEKKFEGSDEKMDDGMDIALCSYDPETKELLFAGANNPLFLIRDGELHITKGDKQPIGKFDDRKPFAHHSVQLQSGDTIVLFSDGYKDQFGGPKDKKFNIKQFKKLLLDINHLAMEDQNQRLLEAFDDWKGEAEQVDDVCIFGVRID